MYRLICFFAFLCGIIIFYVFSFFHVVFKKAHICMKSVEVLLF